MGRLKAWRGGGGSFGAWTAVSGLLAAALLGCSGHHDGLALVEASSATSSSAEVASSAASSVSSATGAGGASSYTSSASSSEAASSSGAGGAMDAGPPEPTTLTVVNGVNDYPSIRLCFRSYPAGGAALPWPAIAAGLAFARSSVIDLASDIVPSASDVRPMVVAGDLAATQGLDCDQILALAGSDAGSSLVVAELPVLPAAVFSSHKSILLAATGCLGGPGHASPQGELACGTGYTENTPNPGLVVLGMNRLKDAAHVTLQVIQASQAMPKSDVRLTPGAPNALEVPLAAALAFGGAGPTPPFSALALGDYGTLTAMAIKTYFAGSSYPTSITPGSAFFDQGNVGTADFANGGSYALVAVGGYPSVPAGGWWHALTYALIRTDP